MARRIWLWGSSRVYCCSGRPNTCNNVSLLQAEASEFRGGELAEATEQINQILDGLRGQEPEGKHLALIDTSLGLLLVWAEAIERPDDISQYVRAESPEDEIREALRISGVPAAAS
jgi:hypothetical protein